MLLAREIQKFYKAIAKGVRPLLPLGILILYTIFGALLFKWIEEKNELYEMEALQKKHDRLLQETAYRIHRLKGLGHYRAYNRTLYILDNYRQQLGVEEPTVDDSKWTFWGAVLYSFTVYTTIGYGNLYPVTTAGRVTTIIYAFIGIPLALISLIALGSLFARICRAAWMIVMKSIEKSSRAVSKDLENQVRKLTTTQEVQREGNENEELLQFPVGVLSFITFAWIFICAGLFLLFETHWTYGTSLYFTIISFTTIGFGDVLPSKPDYIAPIAICLLIGLSLVSTVITLIKQQIEALTTGMDTNIEKEYQKALQMADDGDIRIDQKVDADKNDSVKDDKPLISFDKIKSKMPLKNRLLFNMMSDRNQKQLQKKAERCAGRRMKATQTDDSLLKPLVKSLQESQI